MEGNKYIKGYETIGGKRVVNDYTIKHLFLCWSEVFPNRLYRSSAPYYTEKWKELTGEEDLDKSQFMDRFDILFLVNKNINLIISLNKYELPGTVINNLRFHGIEYLHLKTSDFDVPSFFDLVRAACASRGKCTLVWCGYGQGRTGLMISAIEIISGNKSPQTAIDESTAETTQQEKLLTLLPDNRRLFELCREVARSLREYDASSQKGISAGAGRTASLFGLRKKSAGSVAMHQFLTGLFNSLGIDYRDEAQIINNKETICFGFSAKCPQHPLPWPQQMPDQFSLTYESFSEFLNFYTGRAGKCNYDGLLAGYRVQNPTEPRPGDTLRRLLIGAFNRYQALGLTG